MTNHPTDKNGYVRWVQLITLLMTLSGLSAGLIYKSFDIHSASPHRDAGTVREYDAIRDDLRDIKAEMRQLRQLVMNQQ